ncbi:MAG: transcriptional repressor LexA [Actinomycetota bacterium]|nr:transcriptional repressor LexA [Actinomycetota bacterium]
MAERLHPKRLEILKLLARREGRPGRTPSIREMAEAVGLRSPQTVYHHLNHLEEAGYVGRLDDRPRTPRLTEKGWGAALDGGTPLLGRIAAGRGLEAVVVGDEAYSLAAELLLPGAGKRRYLLRVVGQSMTGARIEDGDLLVVEEDESPPDGAVVVALLNGGEEVTVKRLYRDGDKVRLEPENGEHEGIVVPAEDVKIQGRVVYVVHPPGR